MIPDVRYVKEEDIWWDDNDLVVGDYVYTDAVIHGIRIEGDYDE